MRFRAGPHAGIAACAVLEIDQQEILCFKQSLIQKLIETQPGRNHPWLIGSQAGGGDGFDLLADRGKFL